MARAIIRYSLDGDVCLQAFDRARERRQLSHFRRQRY
jgi:hypothetical protein